VGPEEKVMAELREALWKAADKLRGATDAAQYKDYVLALVFLRYAMDGGRWDQLAARAASDDIGALLDSAMDEIAAASPVLDAALPRPFGGGGVDQRRLAGLVALIAGIAVSGTPRDVLGEAYEYFLEKFARAEGRRGGEFYTPASVVRLLVEMLEPYAGQVYDPCCGSGGMFVQAEKLVLARRGGAAGGGDTAGIAVYGQESNGRTWRLARMNLAIHGIAGDLGNRCADTFREDVHPGLRADFILANPPFNMSDWARQPGDPRWEYGVPPAGNANFAWLQHIVSKLGPQGTAGVVLANGSMSSRQSGEGAIRAALVEAGLVSCVVALPERLFRSTSIPACLWFLARDKGGRRGEVLFIDARAMGTLVSRTERVLLPADIAVIAGAYRAWRGMGAGSVGRGGSGGESGAGPYADVPGLARSASLAEIRSRDHVLAPGQYVGMPELAVPAGAEPVTDKVERLTKELLAGFDESARLEQAVRDQLARRATPRD
jgi:type I restriction enzyme M protein